MMRPWWDDDPAPLWSIIAGVLWFMGLVTALLMVG